MIGRCILAWLGCLGLAWGQEDWPQFRGPHADGKAQASALPPMEWSENDHIAWKSFIPGLGWSSPIIADGMIFLTTAIPEGSGLSLQAMALRESTGDVVWKKEVFALPSTPPIHAKNSHASPTPIFHQGALYVHFGPHGTAKLKSIDGSIAWKTQALDYPPMHGNGGSPILFNQRLFVVCDGSKNPFVAAIDAANGEIAWKTYRSVTAPISHSFVTPTIALVEGEPQLLAPGPDHFAAYRLSDGQELWKIQAQGWSVVPQPTVTQGLVIYNHDYDHPELIAARLGGQGDVTQSHVVWRLKRGAPSTPTPLENQGWLFFVSDKGMASCVDVATGESKWFERLGGNYSASPLLIGDRILFLDEDGVATWVRASDKFEKLSQSTLPGRTFATPAISHNSLYLRTDQAIYKIHQP